MGDTVEGEGVESVGELVFATLVGLAVGRGAWVGDEAHAVLVIAHATTTPQLGGRGQKTVIFSRVQTANRI